jgi:ABC-2 type transport system permease protein
LPANLAAGNVISLTMAYRVNLGRIGRQSGSQANALLSMLIQTTILGIGVGVISLCNIFDRLWLAAPILLALAVVTVLAWLTVLRNVDAMANARRDTLIAKLVKTE